MKRKRFTFSGREALRNDSNNGCGGDYPNAGLLKSGYKRTQIARIRKKKTFYNLPWGEIFRGSSISPILDFSGFARKKSRIWICQTLFVGTA